SEAAAGMTRCSAGSEIPGRRWDSRSTWTRWCRWHADDRAAERTAAEAGAGAVRAGGHRSRRRAGRLPQADHRGGAGRPLRRPQGRRRASLRRARGGGCRGLRDRRDPPGHRAPGGEPRLVSAQGGRIAAAVGEARMIPILVLSNPAERAQALSLRAATGRGDQVTAAVADIIAEVRTRGDAAVRELTERFDGARLESLFLDEARWDALAAKCPAP